VVFRSVCRPCPDADTLDPDEHCFHDPKEGGIEMTATRPILFATDGSPSAAEAQREAFELASRLDAPLVVVSVAHATLPAVGYVGYGYSNIVAELTEAEHKRVRELLATVATSACAAGLSCSTVMVDGFAVEEICEVARERDAQLIVVGSHGWGPARRILSGSVSTGLVHSAPCPVFVVRPRVGAREHAAAA
jgi:nucleotide-binding universal stress UspA family protein